MSRDPRYAPAGPAKSIKAASALKVGDRVRFDGEKQARWKVRAKGEGFVILTKPFNLPSPFDAKCLYTVIDLGLGIRGTHDSYGHGCEGDEQIARTLAALEAEDIEISVRNNVRLLVADVKEARA